MISGQPTLGGQLTAETGWSDDRIIDAARVVEDLLGHPGWPALVEAINTWEQMRLRNMLGGKPSTDAAEYADKVGELKGLRSFVPLAEGVVVAGREAAQRRRELQGAEEASREVA